LLSYFSIFALITQENPKIWQIHENFWPNSGGFPPKEPHFSPKTTGKHFLGLKKHKICFRVMKQTIFDELKI